MTRRKQVRMDAASHLTTKIEVLLRYAPPEFLHIKGVFKHFDVEAFGIGSPDDDEALAARNSGRAQHGAEAIEERLKPLTGERPAGLSKGRRELWGCESRFEWELGVEPISMMDMAFREMAVFEPTFLRSADADEVFGEDDGEGSKRSEEEVKRFLCVFKCVREILGDHYQCYRFLLPDYTIEGSLLKGYAFDVGGSLVGMFVRGW